MWGPSPHPPRIRYARTHARANLLRQMPHPLRRTAHPSSTIDAILKSNSDLATQASRHAACITKPVTANRPTVLERPTTRHGGNPLTNWRVQMIHCDAEAVRKNRRTPMLSFCDEYGGFENSIILTKGWQDGIFTMLADEIDIEDSL